MCTKCGRQFGQMGPVDIKLCKHLHNYVNIIQLISFLTPQVFSFQHTALTLLGMPLSISSTTPSNRDADFTRSTILFRVLLSMVLSRVTVRSMTSLPPIVVSARRQRVNLLP